jgi:hypothetical protein
MGVHDIAHNQGEGHVVFINNYKPILVIHYERWTNNRRGKVGLSFRVFAQASKEIPEGPFDHI